MYSHVELQEEHHRKRTFQEEYLKFLQESGINYDGRYVWYHLRTGPPVELAAKGCASAYRAHGVSTVGTARK